MEEVKPVFMNSNGTGCDKSSDVGLGVEIGTDSSFPIVTLANARVASRVELDWGKAGVEVLP